MGWNSQNIFTVLIVTGGAGSGIFIYSPAPGPGNLIGSWAGTAGVDQYGNAYPAGLSVDEGVLSGVAIQALTETLNPGPLLEYGNTGATIVVLTGSGNWTAPAGVTSVQRFGWGAGGGAAGVGQGAGGGGEFAGDTAPVTPGNNYAYVVGGGSADASGGTTTIASDGATLTAHGGSVAVAGLGGAGGTGSTNTTHFDGGRGAAVLFGATGGAGAGGGAGASSAGGSGAVGSGTHGGTGGLGGTGIYPGGAGGAGGNSGAAGSAGVFPGGGGGAAGNGSATTTAGANGSIILAYTPSGGTTGLINSMATGPGTDPNTGTAYLGGTTNYNPTFGSDIQLYQGQLLVATLTGFSRVQFSNSLLHLVENPPDGNTYSLQRLSLQAAGQTISSTSFATVTGLTAALAVGKYHLRGQLVTTTNVAGGQGQYLFTGTGGLVLSAMGVVMESIALGSPTALANSIRLVALNTDLVDTAFGAANRQISFDGWVTVSTAGTIALQAAVSVAADTFNIVAPDSYMEIFPL